MNEYRSAVPDRAEAQRRDLRVSDTEELNDPYPTHMARLGTVTSYSFACVDPRRGVLGVAAGCWLLADS
jgi:hypothetical protein